ncbi:MAG: septum formation inhibitor Maf [Lysobacter sp.]|nr:septum formation inhibitor Maf [Lysobacter sp.]
MLYLASQSPRRRELLARLGLPFAMLDVDVPEVRAPGESAIDYVRRVARDKARAGLRAARDIGLVIGADTEVVLDDVVFGKPRDAADAAAMLRRLAGRTHQVVSVVVLADAHGEREAVSTSQVTFGALDDATIAAYVASGEPEGKAGAYAIQGAAQAFIAHLSGSYSGVMGLPLHETAGLLRDAGLLGATGPALAGAAA